MNLNSKKSNKPTKLVEVERDELVFSKTPSGKFILKADFRGGKPHHKGGEDYVAQAGDSIFPGKQREEVMEAYNNGNHYKLESMRLKLPKDTNKENEAALGLDLTGAGRGYLERTPELPNILNFGSSSASNPSYTGVNQSGGYFNPLSQSSSGVGIGNPMNLGLGGASSNATPKPSFFSNLIKPTGLGSVAQLAPTIYDLGKGLFEKPVETTKRYLNPQLMKYARDNSGMNEALQAKEQEKRQIRNYSGGNAGVYLSNVGAAENRYKNAVNDINNREYLRENQINNLNTQTLNQAQQGNIGLAGQYDQLDLQNKAGKQNFLRTGLEGLSKYGLTQEQMKNQKDRDNLLLGTLSTQDFYFDPETKSYKFKSDQTSVPKKKNGARYIIPKKKKY